ncbi:hypothetical protein Tco_0032414 [Tanacetum coccineum]
MGRHCSQVTMDKPLCQRTHIAYIMVCFIMVPPSPDIYLGREVQQMPDYIPGPMDARGHLPTDFGSGTTAAAPHHTRRFTRIMLLWFDQMRKPEEWDDEDPRRIQLDEEEEEHPAPADSLPPVHRMTARISIRDEPSISLPPREEVERLLALTTPPPSPLTPLSSPLPQISSPPLPASPLASVLHASPLASPIRLLGYRAAIIRLRAETPSTSHPLPLPTSSPPLQLLSFDRRTDMPEITLPPQKRLGVDLGPRYEIREGSSAAASRPIGGRRADYGFVGTMDTEIRRQRAEEVGYGIRDVWVDPRETVEVVAPMTLEGVNTRVTELTAVQEQDTQDIYAVIRDTQDRQTHIFETLVDASQ